MRLKIVSLKVQLALLKVAVRLLAAVLRPIDRLLFWFCLKMTDFCVRRSVVKGADAGRWGKLAGRFIDGLLVFGRGL